LISSGGCGRVDPVSMESQYLSPRLAAWRRRASVPLIVIALGSVPLLLLEPQRDELLRGDRILLDVVNIVVLLAFTIDYVVGMVLTGDRRTYVRKEILSLVIIVGTVIAFVPELAAFGGLRALRGLPALRAVLVIVRVVAIGGAAAREGRQAIRRRAVSIAVGLAGLTWISAASAFAAIEGIGRDATHPSFMDALWWSAATITTVGYGDVAPVTTAGRLVGFAAMIVGISTFAVVTARIASFLVRVED
jgi:voltage-gated potassium channel